MGQYLLDNNIISGYFSGAYSEKAMLFLSEVIDETPIISVITEIEALSWVNIDKNKENIIKSFINDSYILQLTPAIVSKCVNLRRSRKIKTPDAIIASTAILNELKLITCDKGFENIQNLEVINPLLIF